MKLKPFQQATVRQAVKRLGVGSRRFLVADEVGLGKTLVAQEVIRQLAKKKGANIDVFYVCSSLSIAHQNKEHLLEILPEREREDAKVEVDRLTLLPTQQPSRRGAFTLFTLTPGTMPSNKGHRAGRSDERAVICALLREFVDGFRRQTLIPKALSEGVGKWEADLERAECGLQRSPAKERLALWRKFRRHVTKQLKLGPRAHDSELIKELRESCSTKGDARDLIRGLRMGLSRAALEGLRPSLIILDEFQRFFDEIAPDEVDAVEEDAQGGAMHLMQHLLRGADADAQSPSVLLLSATPYRQYAGWHEGGTAHALEFFALLRFLYGTSAEKKVAGLQTMFEEYSSLLRAGSIGDPRILEVRDQIQKDLSSVIARTERGGLSGEPRSQTAPTIRESRVSALDIAVFRHLRESADPGHRGMVEPLWSSIPYPLQMTDKSYLLNRSAKDRHFAQESGQLLRKNIRSYSSVHSCDGASQLPHPRLRALWNDLDWDGLSLPWIPPSHSWWPLAGDFKKAKESEFSKTLIFSRYRAVPRALASTISYEVERRNLTTHGKKYDYFIRGRSYRTDEFKPRAGLVAQPAAKFQYSEGSAMPLAATLFPFPGLARLANPLRLDGLVLSEASLKQALDAIVEVFRRTLPTTTAATNGSWYKWLGAVEQNAGTWKELVGGWELWISSRIDADEQDRAAGRATTSAQRMLETLRSNRRKPIPERHLRSIARYALLGIGNVCLRAAERVFGPAQGAAASTRIARVINASSDGFRSYFDTPEFHEHFQHKKGSRRAMLRAAWDGNLEATLDEYFVTVQGVGDTTPNATREDRAFEGLDSALGIRDSSIEVSSLGVSGADNFKLRCHAALPFGLSPREVVSQSTNKLRNDFLRTAFNSPFRPYVLVTTSMGQEGLDFHAYCDRLVHWDLPSNPVDIEQREGRIQRHGGLAVRRALVPDDLVMDPERSPWHVIAERQSQSAGGLSPWWITQDAKVHRTVYAPPLSKMHHDLDNLLAALSLYRLTLGQADQEQLLRALQRRVGESENEAELWAWFDKVRIDLCPYGK